PEAVKRVLDEVCMESGADLFLHAFVGSAARKDNLVSAVTFYNHSGAHMVSGNAFVDASGECDLAFFAGASTRYGNQGDANLGTLGTRFGGIPREVKVTAEAIAKAVAVARSHGIGRITKDRSVVARLPGSGDAVCYLASEDYDPREATSITRA